MKNFHKTTCCACGQASDVLVSHVDSNGDNRMICRDCVNTSYSAAADTTKRSLKGKEVKNRVQTLTLSPTGMFYHIENDDETTYKTAINDDGLVLDAAGTVVGYEFNLPLFLKDVVVLNAMLKVKLKETATTGATIFKVNCYTNTEDTYTTYEQTEAKGTLTTLGNQCTSMTTNTGTLKDSLLTNVTAIIRQNTKTTGLSKIVFLVENEAASTDIPRTVADGTAATLEIKYKACVEVDNNAV